MRRILPANRTFITDFMSVTRMPFSLIQTLFIALGYIHAGGNDGITLLLAILTLGPTLIYGGIYILNDVADREYDRTHPAKKQRIVASGRLNERTAIALSAVMLAAGFALAAYISRTFAGWCFVILANNLLYSFRPRLKGYLYLGLFSCSLNYPLRFLAGSSIAYGGLTGLLPAWLIFLVALHGFSAYRIYDHSVISKGRLRGSEWDSLIVVTRSTALMAVLITLVVAYPLKPVFALLAGGYFILFSEVNLGIVRRGVNFFKLLRVGRTIRERPELSYYPAMVALLAVFIVYIVLHTA
ncbi:MAG: UbiA family prenyltransferase [Candidatus Altiarchaeota archaeon]|nr:UbiA family prenyltransferase [Candidatus Altiarchaeota archaeon]